MRFLSRTQALIGDRGLTFTDAIVSYPLCCPSRASFLTGQYMQNTGVFTNFAASNDTAPRPQENSDLIDSQGEELAPSTPVPFPGEPPPTAPAEAWAAFAADAETRSLAVALDDGGYWTGYVGKYLNEYGNATQTGGATRVPPGWDDWRAGVSPWIADYRRTRLNVNGEVVDFAGQYQTDLLADQAIEMLDVAPDGEPFYLQVAFFAPHTGVDTASGANLVAPEVAPRHANLLAEEVAPRSPAFDEIDLSDKPRWLREGRKPLNVNDEAAIDWRYREVARSLLAVDEAVAAVVEHLEALGELDDTVLIFTSDNGYFNGEHRIRGGKYIPYEEALRVPFLIAGAGVTGESAGTEVDAPVANIDVTPTILDLADVEPAGPVDGRSLRPLLDGSEPTDAPPWSNRPILVTGVNGRPGHPTYSGVRTGNGWLYLRYELPGRPAELYDLGIDPHQLENRAGDVAFAAVEERLERQRQLLIRCASTSCDVPPRGFLDLASGFERDGRRRSTSLDAALWAAQRVNAGYADGTFGALGRVSRGQLVRWLWTYASSPAVSQDHGLRDVPRWIDAGVRWAVAYAGVTGYSDGTFRADGAVTRGQSAVWIWEMAGRPAPAGPVADWTDVPVGARSRPAIDWLTADPDGNGPAIAGGYDDGTFRPGEPITRGQAARWLHAYDLTAA